jgi:tRNA dimethylallyltransferase
LYGKPDELYPRLDARVDKMIKNGMFEEMEAMLRKMENGRVVGLDSDYTRGILQAIGFKEFQKYFKCKTDANSNAEQLDKLLKCGIQDMKIATRQYAKRQITWIKNKFAPIILKEHSRNNGALYLIDASGI